MSLLGKALAKFGSFFRLTDEQGQISLTNVAVYVVLVKVLVAKEVSMADLGALLVALLHYSGKKVLAHVKDRAAADDTTADHTEALQTVTEKVAALEERAKKLDGVAALGKVFGK